MTDSARAELRALVNRWDPLGVFAGDGEAPVDEYDCIVDPVLGLLRAGAGAEQVAGFLARHMAEHMFAEPVRAPLAVEQAFAADVLAWYQANTADPAR